VAEVEVEEEGLPSMGMEEEKGEGGITCCVFLLRTSGGCSGEKLLGSE
jgi:hypothetical protein